MAIQYEWVVEWTDVHGDIQDHDRSEKLKEVWPATPGDHYPQDWRPILVLVMDEGNNEVGIINRAWCYPIRSDGALILPHIFSDAWERPTSLKVPKKYITEFSRTISKKSLEA